MLTGDSSGGGLALSALLSLKRNGLPQPGGAVLFCPGVALTFGLRGDASEPHPVISSDVARRVVDGYLGGHPVDDPIVSPLTADLAGLPPLLIQAATGDERCPEAQALAAPGARARGRRAARALPGRDARLPGLLDVPARSDRGARERGPLRAGARRAAEAGGTGS